MVGLKAICYLLLFATFLAFSSYLFFPLGRINLLGLVRSKSDPTNISNNKSPTPSPLSDNLQSHKHPNTRHRAHSLW